MGTIPQRMYAYAMPRQYTMLLTAPYVVIPFFKGAGIFHAKTINGLNSFRFHLCVVENILLAATAEGLAVLHAYSGWRGGTTGRFRFGRAGRV